MEEERETEDWPSVGSHPLELIERVIRLDPRVIRLCRPRGLVPQRPVDGLDAGAPVLAQLGEGPKFRPLGSTELVLRTVRVLGSGILSRTERELFD